MSVESDAFALSSARTRHDPSGVWILKLSVTTTTRRFRRADRSRHASSNRQNVAASRFSPRARTTSPVRQSVAALSWRLGGCTPGARTRFCRPRNIQVRVSVGNRLNSASSCT